MSLELDSESKPAKVAVAVEATAAAVAVAAAEDASPEDSTGELGHEAGDALEEARRGVRPERSDVPFFCPIEGWMR